MSAPELPPVKTFETAHKMSLTKWNRVKHFSADLFNEIDKACGFCHLGRYLARPHESQKCDHCQVTERCEKILKATSLLEAQFDTLIDETIMFLKTLKEVKP